MRTNKAEKPSLTRVKQRTSTRLRSLLPALGIAAFLSLDAYVLHKMLKKDTHAGIESKNPALSQAPDAPVKNIKISDLLAQNKITLDDFILNNSSLLSSVGVPWESFASREIVSTYSPNISPAQVAAL